ASAPSTTQLGPSDARLKSSDHTTPISDRSQTGARLATRVGLVKKLAPVQRKREISEKMPIPEVSRPRLNSLLSRNRISHIRFAAATNRERNDGQLIADQNAWHVHGQHAQGRPRRIYGQELCRWAALNVPKRFRIPSGGGAIGGLKQID